MRMDGPLLSGSLCSFEKGNFAHSSDIFLFLGTLNPFNHDYWLGLGMSLQRCQEYERAIDAYELASLANIESPVPYFYLGKCLLLFMIEK